MKKIIKIIGIFGCAAVLFLNVSLNHKSSTGNIDLSELIVANQADAECIPPDEFAPPEALGMCEWGLCWYGPPVPPYYPPCILGY